MEIALWISIGIVFYTFIGYGILISLLASFRKKLRPDKLSNEDLPNVTILIAAYNEEDIIKSKIDNCLDLDYPKDKLTISFVTDGSDDLTNQIIKQYPEVKLYTQKERKGKISAINRVMPLITTPITVFSDANVMINQEGIKELVLHFQNNLIGAVSGEKRVVSDQKSNAASNEGVYWKYESFLKRKDATWNTLVGSAGELFAIRTHLFRPIDQGTIIEDFILTMKLAEDGYKVAYEPNALAIETASANTQEEAKRKVRIAAGGVQSLWQLKSLFNPFNDWKLSFQLVSHRALRWTLMPLALISSLVLSFLLCPDFWYYDLIFKIQLGFYILAFIGYLLRNQKLKSKLLQTPFYFTFMHVCVMKGWIKYLSGNQRVTWDKAKRAVLS